MSSASIKFRSILKVLFIPFNKDEGLRKHYVYKTTLLKGSGYYYNPTVNLDIIDDERLYRPRKRKTAYMYFCDKFREDIVIFFGFFAILFSFYNVRKLI